jgi:CP family cyanate transporter-like MFS transporter
LILVLAIVFVGMNLRPALLSVGPLVDSLHADLGLSAVALGTLITLPVLCFGAFAPLAPRLLRFQSAERLILLSLLILVLGIGLRSILGIFGLFAGTLVVGFSISVVMVLLPSIIKKHFPVQAGMMMGLYTTALALGAAISAAVTVPLEQLPGSNWRWALGFWLVPAIIAAVVWWPQTASGEHPRNSAHHAVPRLRGNWLAWQVTLFMGAQGAIAYCIFGWLPLILIDRGLAPVEAGFVLAAMMAVQLTTSLAGPWLATRGRDQRLATLAMMILVFVGLMGMLYGEIASVYWWSTIFGLGFGGMFSIAMALLVLRSPNARVAAALSGMAQGVGYTLAAIAPLIVGFLHDYTGNWNAVAVFFVLLICGAACSGLLAGRSKYIEVE